MFTEFFGWYVEPNHINSGQSENGKKSSFHFVKYIEINTELCAKFLPRAFIWMLKKNQQFLGGKTLMPSNEIM